MKRISVFCGSSSGIDASFAINAKLLGQKLAARNIGLVYGGANIGLMGAVADGVLMNQGSVIGVLPHFLESKEIAHEGLTELIFVDTMHERKAKMDDLCDGVITLPGGFGTLEELFEMLTWGQLGLHSKPIGILNSNGYFDPLIDMLDTMVVKGFLKAMAREIVLVSDNIDELLSKMEAYKAPIVEKIISKDTV